MRIKRQSGKSGNQKIVSFFLSIAILLTGTMLLFPIDQAFALGDSAREHGSIGDSNSLGVSDSLGYSGEFIAVHNADELLAISRRVNGGESFANKTVQIKEEILLGDLETWEPIGTEEYPFSGCLDGGGKIIRGIESDNPQFLTLFGYIHNAMVKDTTLAVRCPDELGELDSYLFADMKTSTIQNCHLELDLYPKFRLFGFSLYWADKSWYSASAGSYSISSINHLMGLAELVNEGTANFNGKTITFNGNVDFEDFGASWTPIGTKDRPFEGKFVGAGSGSRINNLPLDNPTLDAAGLFGYIKNAHISNIQMLDAKIAGGNNAGILVGHMTDSQVTSCYTTGSITGVTSVGGVIGYVKNAAATPNAAFQSYSTADVVGTNMVGGFVGQVDGKAQVDTCFAAGNVSGVLEVGGFAGKTSAANSHIFRVASSGYVKGSGKVGGILGAGNNSNHATSSYTSSYVDAFSDSGAIMGAIGNTSNTYTSGYIDGPASDTYIKPGVGYNGTSSSSVANYVCVVNTHGYSSGLSGPTGGTWFQRGVSQSIDEFTAHSLQYPPPPHVPAVSDLPISGHYPQLTAFNSGPAAFRRYSEISTDAYIAHMPTELEFSSGYLATTSTGAPVELPTSVDWTFNDGSKRLEIRDLTVEGGNNIIEITSDNKLKAAHSLVRAHTIVLLGNTGIDGLVIKKTINIKDTDVRPELTSFPPALKTTPGPDADFDNKDRLSDLENSVYIEYSEQVTMKTSPYTISGQLILCDDSWVPTATQLPVTYTQISDTIIKLEWPVNSLGFNQKFQLRIPYIASPEFYIRDGNKQNIDVTYYLISTENTPVSISFSSSVPNATSTSPSGDTQTITMPRLDANYNPTGGYLEGILTENGMGKVVNILDNPLNDEVQFTKVSSLFGSADFPAEGGDIAPDKNNFYKYPGVYTFTYRTKDPEDTTLWSNLITRTYHVTSGNKDLYEVNGTWGETYLERYTPVITLDSEKVGEILLKSTAANANQNIIEEVKKQLQARHEATRISATGANEKLDIQYDFANLTKAAASLYREGFIGVIEYGIDGAKATEPVYLQIEPALNLCDITTEHDRYTINAAAYKAEKVVPYFNPQITKNGIPLSRNTTATWSFEGTIDTSIQYEHQVITIVAKDIFGIKGLEKKKQVIVSIVPEELVPHEYGKDRNMEYDPYFWERVEVNIKKAEPGKVVEAFLDREHANAPYSIFRALSRREDVTLLLVMENGYRLSINSDDLQLDAIKSPADVFNVYIENIQNLDVNRDARNEPVQQFYTRGYENVPCAAKLQVPLKENMLGKKLKKLYTFDLETLEYKYVMDISDSDITNGILSLQLDMIEGEYVIR